MFTGLEDHWLHSSPSSFNEDLRREKQLGKEKGRGEVGGDDGGDGGGGGGG